LSSSPINGLDAKALEDTLLAVSDTPASSERDKSFMDTTSLHWVLVEICRRSILFIEGMYSASVEYRADGSNGCQHYGDFRESIPKRKSKANRMSNITFLL